MRLQRIGDQFFQFAYNLSDIDPCFSKTSIAPSNCVLHICCVSDLYRNTHVPLPKSVMSLPLLSRNVIFLQHQLTEVMSQSHETRWRLSERLRGNQ